MSANRNANSTPRPADFTVPLNALEDTPEARLGLVKRFMKLTEEMIKLSDSEVKSAVESSDVSQQLRKIQELEDEVTCRHNQRDEALQRLRDQLEKHLKDEYMSELKKKAESIIDEAVKELIAQKVKEHFKVPEIITKQAAEHSTLMQHIDTELANCEARRQNASSHLSTGSAWTGPWKPLLRPLPSAAQSPAYVVSSSKPWSMYTAPPTPLTANTISRTNSFCVTPTFASSRFPTSLDELRTLKAGEMKELLDDYELGSSPQSSEDMNTFMAHIGAPYFFASSQGDAANTKSGKAKPALPPLIISSHI